jgi:hypothetical protein
MEESPVANDKPTIILEAQQAADRLEKANMEYSQLLKEMQKLEAFKTLGGKTEINNIEKKEETPQEYAQRIMGAKK